MKQLSQRLRDGELRVLDVPAPAMDEGKVLVRTEASLVSAGTERAKVEIARESLIGKARRRPDQVRQVVDKVRTDGLGATVGAVRARLEALTPLGYCAAGRVERVGARVSDIRAGDLVACGGEEAAHAEILAVPSNLCVPVPAGVDPEEAAFATLGAIALHGFRQADLRLGERVAVIGLGLVGQLSARIAHAAGCEVLGVDLTDWRLDVAKRAGAVDVARLRHEISRDDLDRCDAILVTAAAPGENDPVSLATDLARERGRIVIVGDVLLHLDRRRLYAKELDVRLARSYGPGRYDAEYEQRGLDYPVSYVRWTERRNMAEFLRLLGEHRLEVADLVTHRFEIDDAERAYDALTEPGAHALAVLIGYPSAPAATAEAADRRARTRFVPGSSIGVIGAGGFARRTLMPLARRHGLELARVATSTGLSAASAAEQFGFTRGASSLEEVLADDAVAGVVIATRHDLHAELTLEALRAGKAVLVEKPLCLTSEQLTELRAQLLADGPPLMVGFNRRYAPQLIALREHLDAESGPTNVVIRVNAGPLPADHWLNDPQVGGGRLLGEGCHFLDLLLVLAAADPVAVSAQARPVPGRALQSAEDFVVSIRFADGSLGTLLYGTTGAAVAGKELVEASRGDRTGRVDDFRTVRLWGGRGSAGRRPLAAGRGKGHSEEMRAFAHVVRGELLAPPVDGYLLATEVTLAALASLQSGVEVRLQQVDE